MILRQLTLRHGRKALPRPSTSTIRQWQRSISVTRAKSAEVDSRSLADKQSYRAVLDPSSAEYDPIIADWEFKKHQNALTAKVGADVAPHYHPLHALRNPPRPQDITLELLLASQTHLGHHTSLWHPGNARYIHGIWGERHDAIHIIGLDTTAAHLRRACAVVDGVASRGGIILFAGTRRGHALLIVKAAELSGGYHIFDKWIPGTLTNGVQILKHCRQKVVDEADKHFPGFEPQLENRAPIMPDLVVCSNPRENYVLLHECGIHNIPTIGIVDTDTNPTWVTYPIPANDDSMRSVGVVLGALGRAGEAGRRSRLSQAKRGIFTFKSADGLRKPTRHEVQAGSRGDVRLATRDVDEEQAELDAQRIEHEYNETGTKPELTEEGSADESALMEGGEAPESDESLAMMADYAEEQDEASLRQSDIEMLSSRDDAEDSQQSSAERTAEELDLLARSKDRETASEYEQDEFVEETEQSAIPEQSENLQQSASSEQSEQSEHSEKSEQSQQSEDSKPRDGKV